MHRCLISLFFMLVSAVSVAQAKVCFLPGVFSGDGCISDEQYANCEGFDQLEPCSSGQEEISCTRNGVTRYKCYCRSDSYRLDDGQHPEYRCKSNRPIDPECGCAAKDIECTDEYIYKGDGFGFCKDYPNASGVGACILPNGEAWYKSCECNANKFPHTCFKTGLIPPNNSDAKCRDVLGNSLYKYCECDSAKGWSSDCSQRNDGCTLSSTSVLNGKAIPNNTCYKCEPELCTTTDLLNLSTYLCALTPSTEHNCQTLGYSPASNGRCPAGTKNAGEVGLKCPFDQDYMRCDQYSCRYATKSDCENATTNATCAKNEKGCFELENPETSGCSTGYVAGLEPSSCMEDTYQTDGRISNGEICGKCDCVLEESCVYTYNSNDTTNITINAHTLSPKYVGNADLENKCCNNYYSVCNSHCNGRNLTTDADPNMKNDGYTICEACGEVYYTINACKAGYVLQNNRCEVNVCDTANGFNTLYQALSECETSDGLYQGALGWNLQKQKVSGNDVQSGNLLCTKCVCEADSDCKYDESNKGNAALSDLCCNGKYKSLSIPSEATASACNDSHALDKTSYTRNNETVCVINSCQCGYRKSGNSCVVQSCNSGFSTAHQTASSCGEGLYWDLDLQNASSNGCYKSGNQLCTKCVCKADSNVCKYDESNKGNATLSDLCCNGKYMIY